MKEMYEWRMYEGKDLLGFGLAENLAAAKELFSRFKDIPNTVIEGPFEPGARYESNVEQLKGTNANLHAYPDENIIDHRNRLEYLTGPILYT